MYPRTGRSCNRLLWLGAADYGPLGGKVRHQYQFNPEILVAFAPGEHSVCDPAGGRKTDSVECPPRETTSHMMLVTGEKDSEFHQVSLPGFKNLI
jgi:hypothetical protein